MIAWILISLFAFFAVLTVLFIVLGSIAGDFEGAIGGGFIMFVITLMMLMFLSPSWMGQAQDLAKVTTQHHMVEVYEKRIDSLEHRLNNASYPEKSVVSLDSDSPWATMMNQLSNAETKLADVKAERAKAIRSIEARKNGPMSGVVWIVGDIPQDIRGEL